MFVFACVFNYIHFFGYLEGVTLQTSLLFVNSHPAALNPVSRFIGSECWLFGCGYTMFIAKMKKTKPK